MSGSVNSGCEAADYAKPGTAEMFCKFVSILPALPGWVAATDNRQRGQVQCIEVSCDEKSLWRVGDLPEQTGKVIRLLVDDVLRRFARPAGFCLFVSHRLILIRASAGKDIISVVSHKKGPVPCDTGPLSFLVSR